ncbi:outer membrane protein assembly factor BamA [Comamonas serinivorans]|uniref:Outer membrane protein assembly factor BamA n=2 Tax=Comamonas serinivorans TaxID=1082851 RepID=A0A1Y0EQ51_9BURK|nr:outer membrane protein assembly factor BamA [Comamonas serinivorans]
MIFSAQAAWAVDPFTVRDIRIEGLQRVEPGTVFASLPLQVGDAYDDEKGASAIRSLFALGLFSDVRLEVQNDVLVVVVQERPSVASIEFTGNKEFTKEVLSKALRDIGLYEGRPFDKALADRAEQELRRQYIERGKYAANVVTTVTPTTRNQVHVSFAFTEGESAKIKDIHLVGNRAFSESQLRDLFDLDTGGWLSWYTKSDQYSRTKLNADLEALRSFYLARGYLDFKIDSTQVAISPDKESISVTVNLSEGERFVVSKVDIEGNFLNKDDEFKSLIEIKPGEPYNADQVANTVKAFTDGFARYGYAFAKVEPQMNVDRVDNTVAITLQANPSRRAYVRKINIQGNTRTRDEVIRREFRQFESSWYDGEKMKLSRDRVDRLGYFTDVSLETVEVPGAPDQVDVSVVVKEKPTGSVSIGAGFSSSEKLSFTFAIKQENVFGSGNYLSAELNTGRYNRALVLSTTNPYFTTGGVSRTYDLFYKSVRPYKDQGGNYELITTGGGIKFGVPFSELDTVYFGVTAERTRIKPGTNIPGAYLAYAENYGYTSWGVPLTIGWSRDSRDSALAPTKGRYQRLNTELSALADARYVKANYQFQQYLPLSKSYTLAFNTEVGWGKGFGGRAFPVFKNFYAGGLGSVRGFEQSTLGPRDVTGSFIGGAKRFNANLEFITPFPGVGNDRTLRAFVFVDVGNVYGENESFDLSRMRASTGIGISWISPLGPLRFAFAQPVRKFAGDRIEKLQFQIGTSF